MNYQKIILVGNAAGDAQLRKSKNGDVTFASFRIGVADRKDRATFFPIVVFGKSAEPLAKLISKGRQVLIEGHIQQSEARFDIVADRVELGAVPKSHPTDDASEKALEGEQSETLIVETNQD